MRALAKLLLVLLIAFGTLTLAPRPALAAETYYPSNGAFQLSGHGYGHGRGMSQWGAYGAATQGLSAAQILAFYYPGTALTSQPNWDIKVRLSTAQSGQATVDPVAGMSLVWSGGTLALPSTAPSGRPVTSWRLRNIGGSLVLDHSDSGSSSWQQYSYVPGGWGLFHSPTGRVRLIGADSGRTEYRGLVGAHTTGGTIQAYNAVLMEDYLRSVVPSEMPPSWSKAALQSQAVAARTYASRERHTATGPTHTCDTVQCQVYNGVAKYTASGTLRASYEAASTDQAITATSGRVVITGGAYSYAFTQFSSSNGGYTVAGSAPYLIAKPDPYDGVMPSSANSWTATLSVAQIHAAYPQVGTPTALVVLKRDGNGEWGGRIETLRIVGTAGSVDVTGAAFRTALGMRSTWWTITSPQQPPTPPVQPNGGLLTDINGDGTIDILGQNRTTGAMVLYPGYSPTLFGSGTVVGGGWGGFDWVGSPGDVSGDGIPDLYAREAGTGALYLYPLNRQGVATDKRHIGSGWDWLTMIVAIGDVTGDGVPDVYGRDPSGVLYLYRGAPGGGFNDRSVANHGWNTLDLVVGAGDLDGDGRPDLIARAAADGGLFRYTTGLGGSITSVARINSGWGGFDHIAAAPASGRTYLYARTPNLNSGTLSVYPVSAAGVVSGPTTISYGWSMFSTLI
ncbi:SpoIID/LytB domain-containing protein [Blastococcus sp. Marseille-P5729]|uniref:SpoIID/LytB domain-containing protein n=1 Tax=Blastococcus sp. Marseille-P5729 TaxID=2086582 RepID=UPI000D10B1A1|nr:SpoIID/LytB domain-containing protein [Blastococcus sp. Marseille-P5729]